MISFFYEGGGRGGAIFHFFFCVGFVWILFVGLMFLICYF